MSYYPIDTHATVREFEAAGIETRQAEAIVKAMAWSRNDLVTKTDLSRFATKEDLERFATKEDLERFATKEDLERFATKEDLSGFATKADLEVLDAKLERFATKADLERYADERGFKAFCNEGRSKSFESRDGRDEIGPGKTDQQWRKQDAGLYDQHVRVDSWYDEIPLIGDKLTGGVVQFGITCLSFESVTCFV